MAAAEWSATASPMPFLWERRVLPSPLAETAGGGGGSGGAETNQNGGAGAAGIKGAIIVEYTQ